MNTKAFSRRTFLRMSAMTAAGAALVACAAPIAPQTGSGGDAHATLDQNAHATLDQLFDRLLEKNKGMGSLVLAKDGAVLYSRSFGYRQITENDKKLLTGDTKYRIGSITKMY